MEIFGSLEGLGIGPATLLMFAMLLGLLVTGIPLAFVTLLVALIFALGWFGPMAVPLITSRGCPFSCTFCDRSTSGRKGRMHSVEEVVRLCGELVARGTRHIMFLDDLFTVRKDRVRRLCEAFLDTGFDFTWSCNSHPNLLDLDTMRLMKRAGCWQIAYGVESGSQRMLDVVKHEVRLPRLHETLRLTRSAGIRARGFLMLGHPTEGVDSLAETEAFLRTDLHVGLARRWGFDAGLQVSNLFDVAYAVPVGIEHRQDSIGQPGRRYGLYGSWRF